jgi:diaphanous 1
LEFSSSVEYVTGQSIDLKVSSQVHDIVIEEELESLRSKVDELTDEVGTPLLSSVPGTDAASDFKRNKLRGEVDQQTAEINTLQSLTNVPAPIQKNSGKPGKEVIVLHRPFRLSTDPRFQTQSFHGLVQRLIQKEKQVVQLQADLDRLKAQDPSEGKEAVRQRLEPRVGDDLLSLAG